MKKLIDTLAQLGFEKFYEHMRLLGESIPVDQYYPIRTHAPCRGLTLHPQDFLSLLLKFTEAYHSPVKLNAVVDPPGRGPDHVLSIWGVRDYGLRNGNQAVFLPPAQLGIWSCSLEDLLRFGAMPEQVDELRSTLQLRPDLGFADEAFFQIRFADPLL